MFFCPFSNFFARPQGKAHRQQAQAHPLLHAATPEIPHRAQRRAEEREEQHQTAEDPRQHVQAQLPLPKGHGEVEHRRKGEEGVEAVEQGYAPAPHRLTEGAQQVIQQPQHRP